VINGSGSKTLISYIPDEGKGEPELESTGPAQLVCQEPGLGLLICGHLLHPVHIGSYGSPAPPCTHRFVWVTCSTLRKHVHMGHLLHPVNIGSYGSPAPPCAHRFIWVGHLLHPASIGSYGVRHT